MDATVANFEEEVIKASFEQPVVVDFWAPWCAPCKALAPLLDKLEGEAAGTWKLVKVNTDSEPQIAQALQIKSLPTVKLLFKGRQVSEFHGAQPENVIQRWLAEAMEALGVPAATLPEGEGLEFIKELMASGQVEQALSGLLQLLQTEPENKEAGVMLAKMKFPDDPEGALALVEGWGEEDPGYDGVLAMRELKELLDAVPLEELCPAAESMRVGCEAFWASDFAAAATEWIKVVKADRGWQEDAGRRACVALFVLLGPEHPVTEEQRRALSAVLF
ncbi:MAG: thioredoxin [Myxococcota bacterium]|nr:thioredoxin [Myxococcota bacterium]